MDIFIVINPESEIIYLNVNDNKHGISASLI